MGRKYTPYYEVGTGPCPTNQRASLFTSNTASRQSSASSVAAASNTKASTEDEELASKDTEIGQLKETVKKRESELLKQYMTSRPLVEKVDLTTDDEPASKRQCTETLAGILLEETGQKLVKVK